MLKEALEMHNNLNPALWDKDWNLLPEVEDRIYKIVNKFQSECMLPLDIVDVHLVGSNASFNYNSQSDLDVHIVVNFDLLDVDKEILTAAYNLQKAQFNRDYDISIHGINIEMYIEDINSMTASNGIYSLYNKKWIKKPVKKSYPTLDKRFYDTLDKLADKCERILDGDDGIAITKFINMLYMMRKNGIATGGEFSIGNLLFKEIRNLGLLDQLKDKLKEIQSQELTLENLNESRFSDKELKDIYYACSDRSDNPKYAKLAKSVKDVIDGKKKSFRITDRNDLDLLTYALFPDADYDDPELTKFLSKFNLVNKNLKEVQSEKLTLEQMDEDVLLEIGNPKSIRNGSRRKISAYAGATISPSPGSIVTHHITPLKAGGPTAWNNLFSISGHDFAEAEGVHKLLEYDAKRHLPFNPPYANTYFLEGFTYDPAGNITGKYDIDVDLRIH